MARPAALVLTPRLPWPQHDGGAIVCWQGLLATAQRYETTLISFAPPGAPPALPDEAARLGVRLVSVPFTPPPFLVAALRGLFGRWPYTLARYRSRRFEEAVRREVAARRPAVALVNHLHLATYADALAPTPWVLREHNVECLWMARYARAAGPSPRGAYAAIQASRLRRAEAEGCRRASLVLAIQEEEARYLRALAPGARVETLPVGVAPAVVAAVGPASPPIVLLAASFEWPPNVDGALRFLREGWPRLRASAPNAVLRVAGKSPPPALREACAAASCTLAADVPSMAVEFSRATVLLIPLWVGGGARVKMIEALAAGLPVAATEFAAGGLGLQAGTHFAAGETPEELAEAAAGLVNDPERRAALAASGRDLAAERWSLEAVAALQSRLLASVAGEGSPGRGSA